MKSKTGRKRWLTLGVTFHLSLLFVFKYLSFLAAQLGMLVHKDFSSISLVPSVGEVVKVDLRHFTGSVQRLIEQEKPDLVFVMYTPWYKKDIDWQSHKDEFDFR